MLAARLWVVEVQRLLDDKVILPEDRYMELRYEDLVAKPKEQLSEMLTFCNLNWCDRFERFVDSYRI